MALCVPVGIACGAIIGGAQWLALRHTLRVPAGWILGACLSSVVWDWVFRIDIRPVAAGYTLLASGSVLAAVVQVPLLRRRTSRPVLWLAAAVVSCLAGWYVGLYVGVYLAFHSADLVVY